MNADKDIRSLWMGGIWNVLEFKYFGFVLDESGTVGAKCCREVASGRKEFLLSIKNT